MTDKTLPTLSESASFAGNTLVLTRPNGGTDDENTPGSQILDYMAANLSFDADDIDDTSTTNKFVTASDITNLSNLSGTNTGDQTITLTGDVTGTGTGSFATTVTEGAVTQHQSALSITASQVSDFDTEVSNNTDVAANTSARHAALTVTDSAEIDLTLTGQDLTASIKVGSVDETKLDTSVNASLDLADSSLQSGDIGSTVQAQDAFLDDIAALTDPNADRILFWDDSAGAIGWLTAGSGISITGTTITASSSAPAINDITDVTITTPADNEVLAYDNGSGEWINQTASEAGLAAVSHAHTLSDITDSGALAALDTVGTSEIDNDAVTYSKLQNISATSRMLGRITAGAGNAEELTAAQVRTMINVEDGATADQTAEEIQDAAWSVLSTGTQTRITVTYQDSTNDVDFVVDGDLANYSNANTQFLSSGDNVSSLTNDAGYITSTLTNEQVQDIVGGMVTGNTETLITVTYQDADGTIDFAVNNDLSNYSNATSGFITASSSDNLTNKTGNISQWTNDAGYITATLTNEQVQDIVGSMFSSNTETDITATYQDGDGTIDLVVDTATIRSIPQNSKSTDYTLTLSDAGGHIFHPAADTNNRTFTIPSNSSVAFPIGTAITFVNMSANNLSIAITTDTLTQASTGSSGTRTLAQYGEATALKITSTQWIISGVALT